MLSYKESETGADPARGHQRGRLGRVVHRGRHVVRHARRADDPDLHLLLDVRVPAHRRRLLGRRRPDGPRLRPRRHRRADDAERRGPAARGRPLAAARLDQPGGRRATTRRSASRSGTSSRTACAGCTASEPEDVFYYLTVYNEPYVQPAEPEGARRRRRAARHVPVLGGRRPGGRPEGPAARLRRRPCRGRCARPGAAARRLGRARRRLVGDVLERAAPRRARARTGTTCSTRARTARSAYVTPQLDRPAGPGRRGVGLHARGAGPDPRVGARRLRSRSGPTASGCPTPAARCAGTSRSTPSRSRCATLEALARRGEVDADLPGKAIEKYQLLDVRAADPGLSMGDS